jgi:hypothetical protein
VANFGGKSGTEVEASNQAIYMDIKNKTLRKVLVFTKRKYQEDGKLPEKWWWVELLRSSTLSDKKRVIMNSRGMEGARRIHTLKYFRA